MKVEFELFAFYANPETLDQLIDAGIDGVVIDWEKKGKALRQDQFDTQITKNSTEDLVIVSQRNIKNRICRINGPGFWSKDEINRAIDLGSTEILVPMIKSQEEVECVLNCISGRVKTSIMLETNEALEIAGKLNKMPVERFYVGLNDLSIQRGSSNLFLPFADGTIKQLREMISKKLGVAGLTHPEAGKPILCSAIIHQLKRHNCNFSFLRRSFYKDLSKYTVIDIIESLRAEFDNQIQNEHIADMNEGDKTILTS